MGSGDQGFEKNIMTIGYLDILGMSQAIMDLPIEDVADKYINAHIAETTSHLFVGGEELTGEATPVRYIQFSDSSLFIGGAKTAKDVRLTVAIISGMMTTLLNNWDIVSRGAISIGEFCTIEEYQTYLGKPLVEAAVIESSTDWVGLTLLKPEPEYLSLMEELEKYHWISSLPVPIKPERKERLRRKGISQKRLVAVRWFNSEEPKDAEKLLSRLKHLANISDDNKAQKKLANGLGFIQESLSEGYCKGKS